MVRAAIIGCGKIADQHAQAVHRIPGSEVVAVCDLELLMAQQLAERFRIGRWFDDVAEMLGAVRPDVVHVTTPPQSHAALGRQCLEAGSHVYLEKPFTVTAAEAETMVAAAQSQGLRVTAGHNYQFTPEMMEMRRLVASGFLGGAPVHLESHWSYDLGDRSYVGPLVGNPQHWVRRLPGQLLHNIISHGIARLAEFLDDDAEVVVAAADRSPQMLELGGHDIDDELRVLIRDGQGSTAIFCFSTRIKPGLNQFRICGPASSITVDLVSGSTIRHRGRSDKSYLTFLVPPIVSAREHLRNLRRNAIAIARQRLHQDSGIKALIEGFHRAAAGGPDPIPPREILLTARLMDDIFERTRAARLPPGAALLDAAI